MVNEHPNALPPGHTLHWYRIEKVLGQGGFGITYLARDTNLDKLVALKEYLPVEFAARGEGQTVRPRSGAHGEKYAWGLDRFIKEARMLSGFDHPNIVHVYSVFEFNSTAYMVMRFEQGRNLHEVIGGNENLSESLLKQIVFPILDGLEVVHAAGFIHRDIKPDNVYLRDDGTPVLLDFGSARQSPGDSRTLTILVAPGYAPFEQYYSSGSQQGPWTDIYSLGATLYHAVARFPPVDAIARSKGILGSTRDILIPATQVGADRYSHRFLTAIDHALRFNEKDRPQSIGEWRAELLGETRPEAASPAPPEAAIRGEAGPAAAPTRPSAPQAAPPPPGAGPTDGKVVHGAPDLPSAPPPAPDPAPPVAAGGTGRWKHLAIGAAFVALAGLAAWPHVAPRTAPPAPTVANDDARESARRAAEFRTAVDRLEAARERAESARVVAERETRSERERAGALRERIATLEAQAAEARRAAASPGTGDADALRQAREARDRAEAARVQAEARALDLERQVAGTEALRARLASDTEALETRAKTLDERERGLDAERERLDAEAARIAGLAAAAAPKPASPPAPAAKVAAPGPEPKPAAPAGGKEPDARRADGLAAYRDGDFSGALSLLRPLADAGDAAARYHLGLMNALGQGTPVDDTQAVRWYRMAADQGHSGAQNSLGVMYAAGRGVERDDSAAARWYEKAAKQGHVEAQANLARLFEIGRGLPRDDFQAYGWYYLAARAGNDAARSKVEQVAARLQPLERAHAEKLFAGFAAR